MPEARRGNSLCPCCSLGALGNLEARKRLEGGGVTGQGCWRTMGGAVPEKVPSAHFIVALTAQRIVQLAHGVHVHVEEEERGKRTGRDDEVSSSAPVASHSHQNTQKHTTQSGTVSGKYQCSQVTLRLRPRFSLSQHTQKKKKNASVAFVMKELTLLQKRTVQSRDDSYGSDASSSSPNLVSVRLPSTLRQTRLCPPIALAIKGQHAGSSVPKVKQR